MRAAILALCASLLLTGCIETVQEKLSGCGDRVDVEKTLTAAEAVDTSDGNGWRWQWESDYFEDVCTKKHATASFRFSMNYPFPCTDSWDSWAERRIGFTGGRFPQTYTSHEASGDYNHNTRTHTSEVGTKGAYGDGPGEFWVFGVVEFNSTGDPARNRECFQKLFGAGTMHVTYWKHKE